MIEWLPEGQTVNQKFNREVGMKFRKIFKKKKPDMRKKDSQILHQVNVSIDNPYLWRGL